MRLAVIADVHGNLLALEAVLADIARQGAVAVVNLGDCLSGPLRPAEVADLLIARGIPTLRGNHDRQLLEDAPEAMGRSDAFAHARLTATHRAWLAALPPLMAPAEGVLACHGTLGSDLTYALEVLEGPDALRRARPEEAAARIGPTPGATLILCAHSHLARLTRLPDGRLALNPGSVGCPGYVDDAPFPHRVEAGAPHARYAIATRGPAGWSFDLRAVAYDWDAAAADARAAGREEWASAIATGWIGG
ncbi:metallophosphoesterase family protein [Plastoroseomonas hellenica]|uniref:metallophosphoesterase family protein n=1 Tax=Plastoroseomonas hellenica TaxID=2687306 RepID=UPI001BAA7D0F|nr:metallophosphoesterase family protein [Plastoroseomonas hellenica]